MTNKKEIDIKFLISKIKSNPEVWDLSNECYTDKELKRNAWLNICADMDEDFENKSEWAQDQFVNTIMLKWKNVRDSYFKNLRKQSLEAGTRPYIYSRYLEFLLEKSALSPGEVDDLESIDGDETKTLRNIAIPQTVPRRRRRRYSPTSSPKKSPQSKIRCLQSSASSAVLGFFKSLLPTVNDFTVDEFLEFQTETLNTVKRIRAKSIRAAFGLSQDELEDTENSFISEKDFETTSQVSERESSPSPLDNRSFSFKNAVTEYMEEDPLGIYRRSKNR